MGLTKQYLTHKHVGNLNIVTSGRCNAAFININKTEGRYVACGGAENALIWDVKLGQNTQQFYNDREEVTALRPSPDKIHIAVGYSDGNIKIFSLISNQEVAGLPTHRSAVNVLRYDRMGMQIISGGQDTDCVVADVVSQMGKCRLSGHTGAVTDAHFYEPNEDIVLTSSKDTQIKFWNISTKNCFKTIVDHRSDIWGIALLRNSELLVSGCSDNTLNVYKLSANNIDQSVVTRVIDDEEQASDSSSQLNCNLVGALQRAGKGRTVTIVSDPLGKVLGCHGTDDTVELFYFCDADESLTRLTKRLKKLSVDTNSTEIVKNVTLTDEVRRLTSIKTAKQKIKSIDLLIGLDNELRVIVAFANNFFKLFSLNIMKKHAESTELRSLTQLGHHSEIRTLCFSSDGLTVASGSGDSLKIWSRETMSCMRTIEGTGYILCSCFVPGDRHVLLGLKTGALLIADVLTGDIIEEIPAHKGELWSICLLPNLSGCVTGGGDTTVKIWKFEIIEQDESNDTKMTGNLSLLHQNTLKLEETVFCVKISPNNKFIAVGLLDGTVKIFFLDSFKFYLSLYGHKLPILCLDISSDSTIIATGSADRNVKIWGLDFGDCHRSLFAHDDSVMALQFVPNTHMFWTCGKDGKIKQWDADSFVKICTLPGHIGEAYSLAVDSSGLNLVTCGSDRVIRLFERTDEPLVLQDVQEEEREEMENRQLATGEETTIAGAPNLKLASKKTVGAEKAAESILECLEVSKQYDAFADSELPPLMRAYNVTNTLDYLVTVLSMIRSSDLEEALLVLPFSAVCELLEKIPEMTSKRKDKTELICKIVMFLVCIHQKPIVGNHVLLPVLQRTICQLKEALVELRDLVGTNLHALHLLQREVENRDGIELFRDAAKAKKSKDKKNKRRQLTKRLNIQMS